MKDKLALILGIALAILVGFLLLNYLTLPAHAEYLEEPSCIETQAPDPISFDKNIAKFGTVNATFKWFNEDGNWVLKIDVDPQGGENHRDWRTEYPQGWSTLFKKPVTLPQSITQVTCPEPSPSEEATPSASQGFSEASAPQCGDTAPTLKMANFNVRRVGLLAFVSWFPTDGSGATIYYKESSSAEWQHSSRDLPNNGFTIIGWLTNPNYVFAGQQTNGCAGGELTSPVSVIGNGLFR